MGKNIRRVTKVKLDSKIINVKNEEKEIIYYSGENKKIIYLEKIFLKKRTINKENVNKIKEFNFAHNTKIFRELKHHEILCLKKNKKFIKFQTIKNSKCIEVEIKKKNKPKPKNKKFNGKELFCECINVNENEKNNIIQKNEYLKSLNKEIINFLLLSKKQYINSFICESDENFFSDFNIDKVIESFDELYRKIIEPIDKIYIKDIDEKFLYTNNNKTKARDKNYKGEEKVHLNNYLIYVLNHKDEDINNYIENYRDDFYDFFYSFINTNYQLAKNFCKKDGQFSVVGNEQNKVLKKRLYGNEKKFDLNKHYNNSKKEKRMESIISLGEADREKMIIRVLDVFELEEFKNLLNVQMKKDKIDKVTGEKIIRLWKSYYKETIVKNYGKTQKDDVESFNFIMRLLNEYMKGRCYKARTSSQKKELTKLYLLDIFNSKKIENKFKLALNNKINLFQLKELETKNISSIVSSSIDKQKIKIIQTYYMKLGGKIDFCSKIVDDNDVFNNKEYFKKEVQAFYFNFSMQIQSSFLEYFPDLKSVYQKNDFTIRLDEIINQVKVIRNKSFHSVYDINYICEKTNLDFIKNDIKFLNSVAKKMICEKFDSNSVAKYFDNSMLTLKYKKNIKEININATNQYLLRFDKIYAEIINLLKGSNEIIKGLFDESVVEIITCLTKDHGDKLLLEKKQAIKYLLQSFYYYSFSQSQEDYKYENTTLENFVKSNKDKSIIKGFSSRENQVLKEEIVKNFIYFLKNKVEIIDIKFLQKENNYPNMEEILKNIEVKKVEYIKENRLVCLAYFLDTKNLSQLIHDTKKLLQISNDLKLFDDDKKDILENNIEMMQLILMHKDRVKKINYNKLINDEDNKEIKKIFYDEKMPIEKINSFGVTLKKIAEEKQAIYIECLNKTLNKEDYEDYTKVKYDYQYSNKEDYPKVNYDTQNLYKEGGELIIHSGIEKFIKYNRSAFLDDFLTQNPTYKISKDDVDEFGKLREKIDEIEINDDLKELKTKLKKSNSINENKIIISKELNNINDLVTLNKQKQKYHYLSNKIQFYHLSDINNFIDEVLIRLQGFMQYWERDVNKEIYAVTNKKFEKHMLSCKIDYIKKNLLESDFKVFELKDIEKHNKVRNFLAHNNYYNYENYFKYSIDENNVSSLLDLINLIHDIMAYNIKYQKDVLNVFNKILEKYYIVGNSEKKWKKPLVLRNNKIVIANDFNIKGHSFCYELKLKDQEYAEIIKQALTFKGSQVNK